MLVYGVDLAAGQQGQQLADLAWRRELPRDPECQRAIICPRDLAAQQDSGSRHLDLDMPTVEARRRQGSSTDVLLRKLVEAEATERAMYELAARLVLRVTLAV